MSKRECEEGTLVLPSAALPAFRKTLVTAMNAERQRVLDAATAAYDYLNQPDPPSAPGVPGRRTRLSEFKRATKEPGYRSFEVARDRIYAILEKLDGSLESRGWSRPTNRWNNEVRNQAAWLLVPPVPYKEPQVVKLRAAKKKDYPPLPANTVHFSAESASLSIDVEKRTVTWDVDKSNHAVEHAWESTLGKALKKALEAVTWTRGSGGVFRYSDEYAEDAAMEHGGNPIHISHHFGPLGEQTVEAESGYNPRTMKVKAPRR